MANEIRWHPGLQRPESSAFVCLGIAFGCTATDSLILCDQPSSVVSRTPQTPVMSTRRWSSRPLLWRERQEAAYPNEIGLETNYNDERFLVNKCDCPLPASRRFRVTTITCESSRKFRQMVAGLRVTQMRRLHICHRTLVDCPIDLRQQIRNQRLPPAKCGTPV